MVTEGTRALPPLRGSDPPCQVGNIRNGHLPPAKSGATRKKTGNACWVGSQRAVSEGGVAGPKEEAKLQAQRAVGVLLRRLS